MRKATRESASTQQSVSIARVQSYHAHSYGESRNYAYCGFRENRYFTSDRYKKLDRDFNRLDGKPLKGIGLEIECCCTHIANQTVLAECLEKIIFSHFPEFLFKQQSDCSLQGNSTSECITQVMTKEFIRNQYPNFKLMYDLYFPTFGLSCNDSCGMHVNISNALFGKTEKAQHEAIRKLYYIVNSKYRVCCSLFRRKLSATRYCSQMRSDLDYCKTTAFDDMRTGHGVSFNVDHIEEGRIELRLVAGQASFAAFRNTMEAVFHLIDACKKLSWKDLDDMTKVFAECNQYVFDRLTLVARETNEITAEQLENIRTTVIREELI